MTVFETAGISVSFLRKPATHGLNVRQQRGAIELEVIGGRADVGVLESAGYARANAPVRHCDFPRPWPGASALKKASYPTRLSLPATVSRLMSAIASPFLVESCVARACACVSCARQDGTARRADRLRRWSSSAPSMSSSPADRNGRAGPVRRRRQVSPVRHRIQAARRCRRTPGRPSARRDRRSAGSGYIEPGLG